MPDRARLLAVANECEAAPEPTAALFHRAWSAAYPDNLGGNLGRFCDLVVAGAWTDAALMLVPEGCVWAVSDRGVVWVLPDQMDCQAMGHGSTVPLAVCAAALRVLAKGAAG